jgi:hypothetical protein
MEKHHQAFSKRCSLCNHEKLVTHFLSSITQAGRIHGNVCDHCLGFCDLATQGKKRGKTKLIFATEALLKKTQDDGEDETDWGSGDRGKLLKLLLQLGAHARSNAHAANSKQQEKTEAETKTLAGRRFSEHRAHISANLERGKQSDQAKPSEPPSPQAVDKQRTHSIEGFLTGGYNLLNTNFAKTFIHQGADADRITPSHESKSASSQFQFTEKLTEKNHIKTIDTKWQQKSPTISQSYSSLITPSNNKARSQQTTKASNTINDTLEQARKIWKK